MDKVSIIDQLFNIEDTISGLVTSFGKEARGLDNDASLAISLVQELRFQFEVDLEREAMLASTSPPPPGP